MATPEQGTAPRRIAIIGGGISGLGAAWALQHDPDRFGFRLFEAQDQLGGNAITADMPQDDGSSIPFDISVTACIPSIYHHIVLLMKWKETVPKTVIRHRTDRYHLQLQREVPRRCLRPRLRLRPQSATAPRDCELSTHPATSALVRPPDPCPVEVAERAQPVQLHQHGHGSESGRALGGLQIQDPQADVRQLGVGDKCVRHACIAVRQVSRVLRYRDRHADADMGPGHPAHLRQPLSRLPGQDLPQPARPQGVPPLRPTSWSRTKTASARRSTR